MKYFCPLCRNLLTPKMHLTNRDTDHFPNQYECILQHLFFVTSAVNERSGKRLVVVEQKDQSAT